MTDPNAMATAGTVADSILAWAGQALLYGTVLACVTWLIIRGPALRMRPALQMALWTIVLVKFVLPIGPSSSFSISTLADAVMAHVEKPLARLSPDSDFLDIEPLALSAAESGGDTAAASSAGKFFSVRSVTQWLALIYVLIVGTFASVRIARHRRLVVRCRSLPYVEDSVSKAVRGVCTRLKVSHIPTVRVMDNAGSPFVFGVVQPTLVLPRCALDNPAELEAIILHEIAHLRRGDLFVRCLQWLVGSALFFWPVVAWVNRRIDLARETTCDEWALRHGRLAASAYARCLLRFAKPDRGLAEVNVACAMAANPHNVERRIDMILNGRFVSRLTPGVSVFSIVLLGAWTAVSLTSAAVGGDDEPHGHPHSDLHFGELKLVHEEMAQRASIEFGEAHPSADVDGDGVVTKKEKHAYFIALAMLDPEFVLEQFPLLDADEDGELSLVEITHGFHGARHRTFKERPAKFGHAHEQAGFERKLSNGDVESPHPQHGELEFHAHRADFNSARQLHSSKAIAHWLLQNIEERPTKDEVAEVLTELEAARTAAFLREHPEADLDEDGTLSDDERKQFELARMADHRARVLEKHPEADLDQDGTLSDDEIEQMKSARMVQHLAEVLGLHPELDVDGDGVLSKEELVHFKMRQVELKEVWRPIGNRRMKVNLPLHEGD